MRALTSHRLRFAGLLALAASCALMLAASTAQAAPPDQLWQTCPTGSGSGQCTTPRGVAADPTNGHLFVADQVNRRIGEFNALGQFVRAWGWDVVESGPGDDTTAPEDQFEVCAGGSGDVCKAGTQGGGAGQFAIASGIAIDSIGNVYVADKTGNRRVQKFDRKGSFLLTFGRDVNLTKIEAAAPQPERNLCTAASGDVCQGGTGGDGDGEFSWPVSGAFIAIDRNETPDDADDSVWVGDIGRIQRFDTAGTHQGEIALPGKTVQSLATDAAGDLYYVDNGQPGIHKIGPAGTPIAPEKFELTQFDTNKPVPSAVAVNQVGHLFAFGPPIVESNQVNPIFEFDVNGTLIAEFGIGEFDSSTGLATNLCPGSEAPGNLYVANASSAEAFLRAYGTDPIGCFKARTLPASGIEETAATLKGSVNPTGEAVTECFFEFGTTEAYGQTAQCNNPDASEIGTGTDPVPVQAGASGLAAATTYHFRLVAEVGGELEPGADETFRTKGPPLITEDHTASVTDTEATLRALVNPEGLPTTYRFEYTTRAQFEAVGFEGARATPETPIGEDRSEHPVLANLDGLEPGTAYRWRIVATNTALLNSGVSEGPGHTLNTYLPVTADTGCPNQAFRTEASAALPDCRAYEMVSPVDKGGGDIVRDVTSAGEPGGYTQATPAGDRLTYTAYAAFPGAPSSFRFNQYLAERQERGEPDEGWSNEGLNIPAAGQQVAPEFDTFGFLRYFMGFSPDLCSGWLVDFQTPAPTADAQVGFPNLYRRETCAPGAGSLEALIPSPQYQLPLGTEGNYVDRLSIQGISSDSNHTVFAAKAKLTADAAAGLGAQIYDRFQDGLTVLSVLPGGAPASNAEVGSGPRGGNLERAISGDGSRVYWSSGNLYLRLHPEQGIVEDECDPGVACTVPVSPGTAFFWTASADGSRALYTEGEDLFEFDLARHEAAEEPSRLIASGVRGVAGAGVDLSHIYFVSTAVLPGAGKNSEGDEALVGEPNLYLEENGTKRFVATLGEKDVGEFEPGADVLAYDDVSQSWFLRATRVSADGHRLAFQSRAPLSGYDNTAPDGRAVVEVFAFEAGGELRCVSCNPSGARPNGVEELRDPYSSSWAPGNPTKVPAAAWIPTWEQPLHASNLLSADGDRLFFHSFDALLPRDTNGAQDVYEWESPGTGGCDTDDPDYFAQNGGCLYLISTGESPYESEFWEASADGDDVFFTTESSLLPQDPGSIDLYDARVGGGFPQPTAPAACEGEACQSPPEAPNDPTPGSAAFEGAGNLFKQPQPRSCRKGRVRGSAARRSEIAGDDKRDRATRDPLKKKGRCIKKHKKVNHKGKRHARRRGQK